jgi:membrane associated rhomboid family serine protease
LFATACLYVHFSGHGWGFNIHDLFSQPFAVFGYNFSHVNFDHLIGNLLYLLLLGPAVEAYFGRFRYISFWILCGIGGGIGWALFYPKSVIIGASVANSGLMAVFPFVQRSLVGKLLTGLVFLVMLYNQFGASVSDLINSSDVAHLGHVAGAVTGLILFCLFKRNQ